MATKEITSGRRTSAPKPAARKVVTSKAVVGKGQGATTPRKSATKRTTVRVPKTRDTISAFASVPAVMLALTSQASASIATVSMSFFKTGPGGYGAGDKFLGIRVPNLRALTKRVAAGGVPLAQALLHSAWHEARLLALFALVQLFQRGDSALRERVFKLYLANTKYINNWDMVDSSAPHIVGAYLSEHPKQRRPVLDRLASSENLWERRIAMLATQHFIRNGEVAETLRLATMMLADREDLLHKATGWMLREAMQHTDAARAELVMQFLKQHQNDMPRTMLRYAIERLSATQRKLFLVGRA